MSARRVGLAARLWRAAAAAAAELRAEGAPLSRAPLVLSRAGALEALPETARPAVLGALEGLPIGERHGVTVVVVMMPAPAPATSVDSTALQTMAACLNELKELRELRADEARRLRAENQGDIDEMAAAREELPVHPDHAAALDLTYAALRAEAAERRERARHEAAAAAAAETPREDKAEPC